VALQRQVVTPGGGRLPVWFVSLPILRHWIPTGQQTRLMVLDARTGHPIVISRHLGEIESVTVSRNGRVVATATAAGQIRIWDVPE
jgi:tricorn protease-like protein